MRSAVLMLVFAIWGCSGGASNFQCPTGTLPCGNGCRPASTICCEGQNSSATSSYCTNSAGAGCYQNTSARNCQAGFPLNTVAQFCCSSNGSFGSNDCPAGQHHCGAICQSINVPCCPSNASAPDCPSESNAAPTAVDCGCCRATGVCSSCSTGFCCVGGDLCAGTVKCSPGGGVCVGVPPSGGGGGVCAHWSCGSSTQCAQVLGAPSGVQCTFAAGQTCQDWCHTYVPGNCTCQ